MRRGNRSSRMSPLLLCAAVAIFSVSSANGFLADHNNDVQDARKFLIDQHHLHGVHDPHANDHSAFSFEHFPSHHGDGEHERRWGRIRDWRAEHSLDEKKPEPEPESEGLLSKIWSYASDLTNPWRAVFHPAGHWAKKPVEQEQEKSLGHRHFRHGHGHERFHGSRHVHGFHHDGPRAFFHRLRDIMWKRPERHVAHHLGMTHGGFESSGVLVPTVAKTLDGYFRSALIAKEPSTTCIGIWEQDVKVLVRSLRDALQAQCDSATGQSSHDKICHLYRANPKMAALLAFREADENPVHAAMLRTSMQDVGDCGEHSVSKGWHLLKTLQRHLMVRLGRHFSPDHDVQEHFMLGRFRGHEHEHELREHEGHFGHWRLHKHEPEHEHEQENERKEDEHRFDSSTKLEAIENAHHNPHHDAEHGAKEVRRPWWRLWHAVHASKGDAREHDHANVCKDCFAKGVHRLSRGIKAELSAMCASANDPELVEACQFAREHRCLTKTYLLTAFPVERMVAHRCLHELRMRNDGHFPHSPERVGFRMGRHHPFARPFELGVEERPHMVEVGPHPLFRDHHVMPPFKHWLGGGGCPRHRANQAFRRATQLRGDDNEFPGPLIRAHFIVLRGNQIHPEDVGDLPFASRRLGPGHFRDVVLKLQEHMKTMAAETEAAATSSTESASESAPALEEEPKTDKTLAKPLRHHTLRAGWKNPSRNFRISANPNNFRPSDEEVSKPNFVTLFKDKGRRFRISAKPVPKVADVNGVKKNPVVKDEAVKATDSEVKREKTAEGHPQVIFPVV